MDNFKEIYTELFKNPSYCPVPCERDVYANAKFEQIMKDNTILSIIEVGSGLGHVSRHIHSINPSILIHCADLDNFHKLNYATHIDCDLTVKEDLEKLLVKPHDVLFCLDCLEHLPEETLDAVLETFRKICKWAIISVPNTQSNYTGKLLHLTVKPKEWWDELLQKYFSVENCTVQHGFLFHYTLKPKPTD